MKECKSIHIVMQEPQREAKTLFSMSLLVSVKRPFWTDPRLSAAGECFLRFQRNLITVILQEYAYGSIMGCGCDYADG